jgi:hypothetical protein
VTTLNLAIIQDEAFMKIGVGIEGALASQKELYLFLLLQYHEIN